MCVGCDNYYNGAVLPCLSRPWLPPYSYSTTGNQSINQFICTFKNVLGWNKIWIILEKVYLIFISSVILVIYCVDWLFSFFRGVQWRIQEEAKYQGLENHQSYKLFENIVISNLKVLDNLVCQFNLQYSARAGHVPTFLKSFRSVLGKERSFHR